MVSFITAKCQSVFEYKEDGQTATHKPERKERLPLMPIQAGVYFPLIFTVHFLGCRYDQKPLDSNEL